MSTLSSFNKNIPLTVESEESSRGYKSALHRWLEERERKKVKPHNKEKRLKYLPLPNKMYKFPSFQRLPF